MAKPTKGRVLVKVTEKQTDSVIVGATEKTRKIVAVADDVTEVKVGDLIPHSVESPACRIVTDEGVLYSVKVLDIQCVL